MHSSSWSSLDLVYGHILLDDIGRTFTALLVLHIKLAEK